MVAPEPTELYRRAAWRLRSEKLELGFLPGPGGRLISLRFEGMELLYADLDLQQISPADTLRAYDNGGFPLWGGDKTWVAPQAAWPGSRPLRDLDGGEYRRIESKDSFILESAPCSETGLQVRREFRLQANVAHLEESIVNCSGHVRALGVWNVSQFLRPALVFVAVEPQQLIAHANEGQSVQLLSQRVRAAASGWSQIDCQSPAHFKYGAVTGAAPLYALLIRQHKCVGVERSSAALPGARFAHGADVEIYNSPDRNYLELERHSAMVDLAPGECIRLAQRWRFCSAQADDDLPALLARFQAMASLA
ncbi:MAG: hypothetical protein K1X75_14555 [Leptospirales bacterium]|nr:hypothetical protein [Leptospirales bacterium]